MECHQLQRSLFNTFKALRIWNRDHFGIAQTRIKNLEDELGRLSMDGNEGKRISILEDLCIQRARLESILCQKSQETWLKKGDKNSGFFHTSLTIKRRKNKILSIK